MQLLRIIQKRWLFLINLLYSFFYIKQFPQTQKSFARFHIWINIVFFTLKFLWGIIEMCLKFFFHKIMVIYCFAQCKKLCFFPNKIISKRKLMYYFSYEFLNSFIIYQRKNIKLLQFAYNSLKAIIKRRIKVHYREFFSFNWTSNFFLC